MDVGITVTIEKQATNGSQNVCGEKWSKTDHTLVDEQIQKFMLQMVFEDRESSYEELILNVTVAH